MLTTTATFDLYRMRPNAEAKFLLTIAGESPSRTFYLADERINLSGSGEVFEPLVISWGTIRKTMDLFTKKANVGNVKIKLSNAPYKRNTSGDVSISDDLFSSKIINRTAKIYLWFEGITDLSDCLKIFEGLVQPPEKATPETILIRLLDSTFKRHAIIPPNKVNTTDWPNAPPETLDLPLPLHYGAFTINKDDNAPVAGVMAEAIWVSAEKVVVSDHLMNSVSAIWIFDPDLGELVKVDSGEYTATLDDSGRTTITFDNILDPLLEAWLYPEMIEIDHVSTPAYILLDEEKRRVYDKDSDSFMEATVESYAPNGNQDASHEDKLYARFKNATPVGDHQNVYLNSRYDNAGMNPPLHWKSNLTFWRDSPPSGCGTQSMTGTNKVTYHETDITSSFNALGLTMQDLSYPNGLMANIGGYKRVADGTRKKIGEYYDIRLRVTFKRSLEPAMRVFVEGNGRKYGSWIDGGGRSNSYNSGDMIENPAGIIESILRDELSVPTADIDEDSFDDALGDLASWDQAVSIIDFINTENLIMAICKQAKMNFFFSNDDKAKVRIIDNSPTTEDDTFEKNNIQRNELSLDKGELKSLINKIRLLYKPWPVDGKFESVTEAENTTSQDDNDITIEKHIKAANIFQDSVANNLRDHYSGSSGFWKDLREILEVDMKTWEKIVVEEGDLIEPQSDIDPLLKDFNSSWGSQLFMIIEKQISQDTLSFKMMRVN